MKRVLLVGAGHAHLALLDSLSREPLRGIRFTLVTPREMQIYSGMLPGVIAGHYRLAEAEIDVAGLAERAYAEVVLGQATAVREKAVVLEDGQAFPFDFASLNVGSCVAAVPGDEQAIPAKPFESLVARLRRGVRTAVIGGGAAGAELAMALRHAGAEVAVYAATEVDGRIARALRRRGVSLIGLAAERIEGLTVHSGKSRAEYDQIVLASGAAPHAWLASSSFRKDDAGFLAVDDFLRSVSHPEVFACGDCATQEGGHYPRSGVYAVRHGELLARNFRRMATDQPLLPYRPQERALLLLSCGERYAIARRGEWSAEGRLLWYLKDRIDRRWVARLNGGR